MYCRGEDNRIEIVKEFEVLPLAHVKLLAGQTKKSCTGDELISSYYCFNYSARNGSENGVLLCGSHAADHFLSLIGHPGLALFNPLASLVSSNGGNGGGSSGGGKVQWHAAAKQLHDAINLLVVCWSTVPGAALLGVKTKLEKFPGSSPFASQVKAVNTVIGRDYKKRSLSQMIAELAVNNNLRKFNFSDLDSILAAENVPSNFT